MFFSDYKTILSPQNGMNLFRGCSHGCIYCDSRSKCYRIGHDFEDIEIKRNAAEILEAQLKKRRKRCMISTGSMCDPYMPYMDMLKEECAKHDILSGTDEVFSYIRQFEPKQKQTALF